MQLYYTVAFTDVQELFSSVLKANQRLKSSFSHNTQDQPVSSNSIEPTLLCPTSKTGILTHLSLLIRIIHPTKFICHCVIILSVLRMHTFMIPKFFGLDHSYFINKLRYLHAL